MEDIKITKPKGLNSLAIRVVAMSTMLCDHIWVTLAPDIHWLHYIGRLAFPLFAFLLVEGFLHTSNRWNYANRLFIFAALSEIPFNLMTNGQLAYIGHQNVLWTFWIGLLAMMVIDKVKTRVDNVVITGISTILVLYGSMYIANNLHTDYAGYGILTIIVFYTCYNLRYEWLGQFFGLLYINVVLLAGKTLPLNLLGTSVAFPVQSFAILSLFFIRKYNGLQGHYNKTEQYLFYVFYPLHMLILALLALNGVHWVL